MYTRININISTIVEAVVASHIARYRSIYYWRNRSEVDIVMLINRKPIGVEVKWTRKLRFLKNLLKHMFYTKI